jgi:hypothetical protein
VRFDWQRLRLLRAALHRGGYMTEWPAAVAGHSFFAGKAELGSAPGIEPPGKYDF